MPILENFNTKGSKTFFNERGVVTVILILFILVLVIGTIIFTFKAQKYVVPNEKRKPTVFSINEVTLPILAKFLIIP